MARVLATYSDSHPIRLDILQEELGNTSLTELELPAGGLKVGEDKIINAVRKNEPDGIYMRPGHITQDVLDSAPNLKVIALSGSGYDHVDLTAATEDGVVVTHSPGAPGPAVMEHTFGFIFSLLRNLPDLYKQMDKGKWMDAREDVGQKLTELSSCTLGVIGLGTIGLDVAQGATRQFDSEVIGYDPYVTGQLESPVWPRVDRETIEEQGIELVELKELCERSDIVTIHVPLTEETRNLISEEELKELEGGYLINTSRGGVIDEDDLAKAVQRDQLAGVALDVLENEPPSPNNPLFDKSNVFITPHIAGVTDAFLERSASLGATKILSVLNEEEPNTVLNPRVFEKFD